MRRSRRSRPYKQPPPLLCPFCTKGVSRNIVAVHQHMLTQHNLPLSRGEMSQLMAACRPTKETDQHTALPIVQHLKNRMDAARSAQGHALNNLENQKAVSEAQQQAMRDRERETRAAVSAQLAAAFATPRIKEGLTRLVSHKQ